MLLINNINNNRCESVCYTKMGNFLPMIEGDMTFNEYMDEKNKEVTLIKNKCQHKMVDIYFFF